jgi:hypothetical protein
MLLHAKNVVQTAIVENKLIRRAENQEASEIAMEVHTLSNTNNNCFVSIKTIPDHVRPKLP